MGFQIQTTRTARRGYERLALNYYTDNHPTCRNFDAATAHVLAGLSVPVEPDQVVLDIGCGRGRLEEFLAVSNSRTLAIDAASGMLDQVPARISRVQAVAERLPMAPESAGLVGAFLFDPFNVPEFYREVSRILEPGGYFVGTLPHPEWGWPLRDHLGWHRDETRFLMTDGSHHTVPSFLSTEHSIWRRCRTVGLQPLLGTSACLPRIHKEVSPHVRIPAELLRISPHKLPIVQVIVARKADDPSGSSVRRR